MNLFSWYPNSTKELECKDEYKEKEDDARGEELLEMVSLSEVASQMLC